MFWKLLGHKIIENAYYTDHLIHMIIGKLLKSCKYYEWFKKYDIALGTIQKTLLGGGRWLFVSEMWVPPLRISRIWVPPLYIFFEFSDASQSIHKDGFWQSLM